MLLIGQRAQHYLPTTRHISSVMGVSTCSVTTKGEICAATCSYICINKILLPVPLPTTKPPHMTVSTIVPSLIPAVLSAVTQFWDWYILICVGK